MRLGITLWGFALGYREAVDLAPRVEAAGFDNLFMVEGPLSNDGVTTVAMMAARTSRLLLGTNIANVYLRHPRMLGMAAVAIDEVAPGRLILGLGPNNRTMITQAGFMWRDPRAVLQETTAALRDLFAGKPGPGPRTPRPASHTIPIHWAAMALETCAAAGAPRRRPHALPEHAGALPACGRALSAGGRRGGPRSCRPLRESVDSDLPP